MPILSPKREYNQPFFCLADAATAAAAAAATDSHPPKKVVKILAKREYFITHLAVIGGWCAGRPFTKINQNMERNFGDERKIFALLSN